MFYFISSFKVFFLISIKLSSTYIKHIYKNLMRTRAIPIDEIYLNMAAVWKVFLPEFILNAKSQLPCDHIYFQ